MSVTMNTNVEPLDLLSPPALAARLGISVVTVRNWARAGKIPARRFSHKVQRFNLREVISALESPKTPNSAP